MLWLLLMFYHFCYIFYNQCICQIIYRLKLLDKSLLKYPFKHYKESTTKHTSDMSFDIASHELFYCTNKEFTVRLVFVLRSYLLSDWGLKWAASGLYSKSKAEMLPYLTIKLLKNQRSWWNDYLWIFFRTCVT
jgi:hypothetical protein